MRVPLFGANLGLLKPLSKKATLITRIPYRNTTRGTGYHESLLFAAAALAAAAAAAVHAAAAAAAAMLERIADAACCLTYCEAALLPGVNGVLGDERRFEAGGC